MTDKTVIVLKDGDECPLEVMVAEVHHEFIETAELRTEDGNLIRKLTDEHL